MRGNPYVTLNVSTESERGLLGIAVDPSYATNHYVYLYYTTGPGALSYSGSPKNRVSRFKTSNGVGTQETILLDGIPSDAGNHNGGDIHFGFDGKLYIAVGDGGTLHDEAQVQDSLRGKILRINCGRHDPYGQSVLRYEYPQATIGLCLRVSQSVPLYRARIEPDLHRRGCRTIDVGRGGLTARRGQLRVERLRGSLPGEQSGVQSGDDQLRQHDRADSLLQRIAAPARPATSSSAECSPSDSNYPSPYAGAYFYGDNGAGWVHALTMDSSNVVTNRYDFDQLSCPVSFAEGPDGNVYVADICSGDIDKYVYAP